MCRGWTNSVSLKPICNPSSALVCCKISADTGTQPFGGENDIPSSSSRSGSSSNAMLTLKVMSDDRLSPCFSVHLESTVIAAIKIRNLNFITFLLLVLQPADLYDDSAVVCYPSKLLQSCEDILDGRAQFFPADSIEVFLFTGEVKCAVEMRETFTRSQRSGPGRCFQLVKRSQWFGAR